MDIAFKPSILLPIIFAAVVIVAVLSVLLKKGAMWRKITGIAISVAVCGTLMFFLYRTTHLFVDEQGIRATTYGKVSIPWQSVKKAVLLESLSASPYNPVRRTNGVAMGDFRAGWFSLGDGRTAFVTVQGTDRALVLETEGKLYVFGVGDMDAFLQEVSRHVILQER
jgi:hypothetical protein